MKHCSSRRCSSGVKYLLLLVCCVLASGSVARASTVAPGVYARGGHDLYVGVERNVPDPALNDFFDPGAQHVGPLSDSAGLRRRLSLRGRVQAHALCARLTDALEDGLDVRGGVVRSGQRVTVQPEDMGQVLRRDEDSGVCRVHERCWDLEGRIRQKKAVKHVYRVSCG